MRSACLRALRRKRQERVQLRIPRFNPRVKVRRQLPRRNLLRRQRLSYPVNRPLRRHRQVDPRPDPCFLYFLYFLYLSITFGTRKYGGSGSGACFNTSSATAHGTTKSSRSVASAVWSSLSTCAIGSTFVVSSSFSFPMYSRISSICVRYVSSSASLKSR